MLGAGFLAGDRGPRHRRAAAAAVPRRNRRAAGSSPEIRIAAVVNDEVISVADLSSRIRMVDALDQHSPIRRRCAQRIASQVLRTMIDEKLQMQEAKRKNVTATDDEINKAISSIEKQNNMQPGQLDGS